ncbi:MAG: hypothetical protein JW993_16060 [Sedimentisphaerales bacterium]|nr:hypothetical protein [Sedimentisphaerales bacterium]
MGENLKRLSLMTVILILCAGGLVALPGCKSEDNVVAIETNPLCPNCHTETRVQPITGLTYTTCICPACKKVSTLDAPTLAAVEAYTGAGVGNTVRVCDSCEALIGECAACRQSKGM